MARPREFDRDEVLEKAMRVFWSKGYECTSMQDLVTAMGVNRGSLYAEFGDKERLHLAALERFYDNEITPQFVVLDRPRPLKENLRDLFLAVAESERHGAGCMISHAAVELCPDDAEVGSMVGAGLRRAEATAHRALIRARDNGELGAESNLRALARYLISSVNGVRVIARAIDDPKTVRDIVETTLSVFK